MTLGGRAAYFPFPLRQGKWFCLWVRKQSSQGWRLPVQGSFPSFWVVVERPEMASCDQELLGAPSGQGNHPCLSLSKKGLLTFSLGRCAAFGVCWVGLRGTSLGQQLRTCRVSSLCFSHFTLEVPPSLVTREDIWQRGIAVSWEEARGVVWPST